MPLQSQLHVDKLLSNISVKYRNADFIAMQIFPEVPVKTDSDKYRIYGPNFRLPETRRANKGIARDHTFEASTATYILEDHAIKDYVSEDDKDNWEEADLYADTTEELTDVILRRLEYSVSRLFTTTSWSLNTSLASGAAWNLDTIASNPIPIVDTAASSVLRNSGFFPNLMVVGYDAFNGVKNHQSVLDRYKYSQAGVITAEILGALFGVRDFLVSKAQLDTSALGATDTAGQMWSDVAFVGYRPDSPSIKSPSCGYLFRKNVPMTRRWHDDERNADAIEVRMKYQARIVASLAGYLIKDVV